MSNPNPIFGRAGEDLLSRFSEFMRIKRSTPTSEGTVPREPTPRPNAPTRGSSSNDPISAIADMIRRALLGPPEESLTTLPAITVARPEERPDPTFFNNQGVPYQSLVPPSISGAGRVFHRNGKFLIDVDRRWGDGRTSTHNIALLPPEVQRGDMDVKSYEDLVLRRPRNLFSRDVERVDNSLDTLEPDARTRFEQLREAANQEGIRLRVGETRRSQERQDWLFQQGRSRPGPIVTWTLTSDHRDGRALDLLAPNQKGYEWLWENASRFGFRAMGAVDPGHIYVPRDSR